MAEDETAKPTEKMESEQPDFLKEHLKKMHKRTEGRERTETGRRFRVDQVLIDQADSYLGHEAERQMSQAKEIRDKLEDPGLSDTYRKRLEKKLKKVEERGTVFATAVGPEKKGLKDSKSRAYLLAGLEEDRIDQLPEEVGRLVRERDSVQRRPREWRVITGDIRQAVRDIDDPKERARARSLLRERDDLRVLGAKLDRAVGGRAGLRERFVDWVGGDANETSFRRWMARRISLAGLWYDRIRRPEMMSQATREMMEGGADELKLAWALEMEEIEKVEKTVLKRMEGEESKEEKGEEEEERAKQEEENLSDEEKEAQKRLEEMDRKIKKIRKDVDEGKISLEESFKKINEVMRGAEEPEKSVEELDEELDEDIEESVARGSDWTENIDAREAKGLIRELAGGTPLNRVAQELFPGNEKAQKTKRMNFIQEFKDGMKAVGIINEEEYKSATLGDIEKKFRSAVEKALDKDERARRDREYRKNRRTYGYLLAVEGTWDYLKQGLRQGFGDTLS